MSANIILNNSGNDSYYALSRDWLSTPILTRFMKLILADESQLASILQIKNKIFAGAQNNRKLSLSSYVNAQSKSNLILLIPFDPPLILDGNTYFTMTIPANSTVIMAFYYDQRKEFTSLT